MTCQDTYYVPKRSGTLADPLEAYGLATLLDALTAAAPGRRPNQSRLITIEDDGNYVIHLREPIQPSWLETKQLVGIDLARPIRRVAKGKTAPTSGKNAIPEELTAIDYNAIWDEIRSANTLIDAHRKQHGSISRKEIQDFKEGQQVQPDREVALLIGDYRMQVEAIHNQAVIQWYTVAKAGYQAANLRAILALYASPNTDEQAIVKAWKAEVKGLPVSATFTASQVYNPSMGKGQNSPKADQLTMGNESELWFVTFLKAVGQFTATVPRLFSDHDMRKTYVLAPARIELNAHRRIFEQFKRNVGDAETTPIKADILMSLDYASAYLSYSAEAKRESDDPPDLNPRSSIRGFHVATYVLLSQNSFTTINLSFLGLPPWLRHIAGPSDAQAVQEIIDEHEAVIRPLQEKFQEEGSLLDAYRDFVTGARVEAFFDFCAGYGEYMLRMVRENPRVRQLSVTALDQIFRRISMDEQETTAPDFTEFVSTSDHHRGFHQIAYAIRQSTVIPQRQNANFKSKARAEKSLYDVRYGLGNNLRRKSDVPGDFFEALTEFMHSYNAETEQVYENTSEARRQNPNEYARDHYRQRISFEDLDDVIQLATRYGSRLVCSMLVAYGYAAGARGSRAWEQNTDSDTSSANTSQEG